MSKLRDRWTTPDWLYGWLDVLYHFDADLAADFTNSKHDVFFCEADDSLAQPWNEYGKTGFLNPPYSDVTPWIQKAINEQSMGFTTVMLLPTPNGEAYWTNVFTWATEIIYIIGRVNFDSPDPSDKQSSNPRGSCIVVFGQRGSPSPFDWNDKPAPVLRYLHRDEMRAL